MKVCQLVHADFPWSRFSCCYESWDYMILSSIELEWVGLFMSACFWWNQIRAMQHSTYMCTYDLHIFMHYAKILIQWQRTVFILGMLSMDRTWGEPSAAAPQAVFEQYWLKTWVLINAGGKHLQAKNDQQSRTVSRNTSTNTLSDLFLQDLRNTCFSLLFDHMVSMRLSDCFSWLTCLAGRWTGCTSWASWFIRKEGPKKFLLLELQPLVFTLAVWTPTVSGMTAPISFQTKRWREPFFFFFSLYSCAFCGYCCCSCCSSCSCCSRSCCSCSRCGCGCEPVLDCFRYFLSSPVIGFRADLPHNISLCTDSTYTRLWDYKYKRLWSRNKREWTVNESLSISPCRLSLVQVFMLLRVMRLHDLIIHWVRMSWLIYVSMFLVDQIRAMQRSTYMCTYDLHIFMHYAKILIQWQRTVFILGMLSMDRTWVSLQLLLLRQFLSSTGWKLECW